MWNLIDIRTWLKLISVQILLSGNHIRQISDCSDMIQGLFTVQKISCECSKKDFNPIWFVFTRIYLTRTMRLDPMIDSYPKKSIRLLQHRLIRPYMKLIYENTNFEVVFRTYKIERAGMGETFTIFKWNF